jgi:hypothetical protein
MVGCALNRPFRTGFNPGDPTQPGPDPTNAVIEATADYKMGFVEFDDQGWLWDVRQKSAVLQLISNECGLGTDHPSAVVMVLFVHGWKNNAAFDDGNVQTFRSALTEMNGLETELSKQQGRQPRKLVGVYAGWRGLSIKSDFFPIPLGKETTFWGRKNAAQRVGGYGAMTELMMDLEALQRAGNQSLPTNASQTKLIIVGHSFGADAVYNAISQIVAGRFVDTIKQGPERLLKPVGDQVILLNPAFEAARFYDLAQLARSVAAYAPDQRPVLSVFQSRGDWATRDFFPIGQAVATVFQQHRSSFQKTANHQSVGWFEPFITHDLNYEPTAAAPPTNAPAGPSTEKPELRARERFSRAARNIIAQRRLWRLSSAQITTNMIGNCAMISRPNYRLRNPILVVSVDTAIMKDHDDIGNPRLIDFLQNYIPFCDDQPPTSAQP